MAAKRLIVIGAGIAGLASAIRLAGEGFAVTVLEAADGPGGKLSAADVEGRAIDCGPTVLTMRWVFDALFEETGANFDDYVPLLRADVLARHAWDDPATASDEQTTLDLFADPERSVDAVHAFAGRRNAEGFVRFLKRAEAVYDTLAPTFMEAQRPSLPGLVARVAARNPIGLSRIQPFETLWSALGRYFPDPRLRQLFARYATYCGSSPYSSPATLMLVAHVEQMGVWFIRDGLVQLADGLARRAEELGVDLRFGARVTAIETTSSRARAIRLEDGQRIAAEAIVYNGDVNALDGLLVDAETNAATAIGRHSFRRSQRSQSAVTVSTVARPVGFPLSHHNVFFSNRYRDEFDAVFKRGALPASPTVYVCAQDRDTGEPPPKDGRERLFFLINAPATGDMPASDPSHLHQAETDQCLTAMTRLLERAGLVLEAQSATPQVATPATFETRFPGSGGALYGMASHGWRASFLRRGAKSRLANLYLAGGSVHPGPGMPMAALSGRLAAMRLMSDLASTSRLHPVAMPGGIAMPSAKTGNTA
ncbi:MAG: 1-hydroxycarotenoid 3,4-desaturase CrtD [Pseudomonadota bacterium]